MNEEQTLEVREALEVAKTLCRHEPVSRHEFACRRIAVALRLNTTNCTPRSCRIAP